MNPNATRRVVAACFVGLMTAQASASITVTSRLSNAQERGESHWPPPDGFYSYGTSESYTELGKWSVTLPHGFVHSSEVSGRLVSGSFAGSYRFSRLSLDWSLTESSLETGFTVTGSNVRTKVSLDGGGFPVTGRGLVPETLNAYAAIYNSDTNVVVFDSFDYGVFTPVGPSSPGYILWQSVTTSIVLAPGNYRLVIGANSNATYGGPASGQVVADSKLAAEFTFGCSGDFDSNYLVDDADFTVFVLAYEFLLCSDAAMPVGCPADLNGDALVDDVDFQIFGQSYDVLLCP